MCSDEKHSVPLRQNLQQQVPSKPDRMLKDLVNLDQFDPLELSPIWVYANKRSKT